MTHWAFGNDEELAAAIAASADVTHPATREIRAFVSGDDSTALERFRGARDALVAMAPGKAMSAAAKKRRKAVEKALMTESDEVAAARNALAEDPGAATARELLDELAALSTKDAFSAEARARRGPAMRELADAVDARWLPILLHHQRLAARYVDSHKLAIPGLVLAIAGASDSYAAFRQHVDACGTGSFGLHRREELALAVGRFIDDDDARAWLVDQARTWVARVHEWDVWPSPAFRYVLLEHPLPETFELIRAVLSCEALHGGNWGIIMKTAAHAALLGMPDMQQRQRELLEKEQPRAKGAWLDEVNAALDKLGAG